MHVDDLRRIQRERAYQRGTLWPKRVHLMADWANYCGQVAASNVVELKQGAA